jgi:hypothetical protein
MELVATWIAAAVVDVAGHHGLRGAYGPHASIGRWRRFTSSGWRQAGRPWPGDFRAGSPFPAPRRKNAPWHR